MAQPQPVELESLSPQEIDYVRKSIEEVRLYLIKTTLSDSLLRLAF